MSDVTTDLAARVLAAIEAKEVRLRRAGDTMGHLTSGQGGTGGVESLVGIRTCLDMLDTTIEAELRRCAADRDLIAQVQAWKHDYNDDDPWYSCAQAVMHELDRGSDPNDALPGSGCIDEDRAGRPCDCPTGPRREQVLTALARSYGITPERVE